MDFIVRPGSYTITSTGAVKQSATPLVDAMRFGQALKRGVFIAVEGVHPGFQFCEAVTKKNNVSPSAPTEKMWPISLVGATPDAEVGPITFWRKTGDPGPLTLSDLTIRPTSKNRYCILTAKQNTFFSVELQLNRVRLLSAWPETVLNKIQTAARAVGRVALPFLVGDGAPKQCADWGLNLHGPVLGVDLNQVTADGFGEHVLYAHNPRKYLLVRRSIMADCGRTAVQLVNREWESKDGTGPTNVPSTPDDFQYEISDNLIVDCSSYPDATAKGGWMANGSAITVAGCPGTGRILRNRVVQTHPGGGGISIWGDKAKIGQFTTLDGYANGDVEVLDNDLHIMAGAAAGREAMQLGASRKITCLRNTLSGSEKRVAIGHTGKIGEWLYDGSILKGTVGS